MSGGCGILLASSSTLERDIHFLMDITFEPDEIKCIMFAVTSFQAMPINSLHVPSPSLGLYQYNKLDMKAFCKQNFTIVSTSLCSISAGSNFYPWE